MTGLLHGKGLFTPSESESESKKDPRTIKNDQRISDEQ